MMPANRTPKPPRSAGREPGLAERRAHQYRTGSVVMLERELERLSARVRQLELEKESVEAFAAIAAHELVQPLVMTEAYASIVSDRLQEPQHADSRRDLDALARSAARVRLLVESLLHDAYAGARELTRGPVDLGAVVDDVLVLLGPEIASRYARVEVGRLPRVMGEESLLSSLFANLLVNALKYSPRTRARIRVGAVRDEEAWLIFVESEGPSVGPEERELIFQPYQRGHGERRARGAGLGLTICRRIVERHGGRIGVVAANGTGNRFYFTLPA